jgi:hypothetical protein
MNSPRASGGSSFGFNDFALRLAAALVMVFATWNPSGYSFVEWAWHAPSFGAAHAFCGVLVLIGWVILLRATFNSLGWLGLILGGMLLAAGVWLLYDLGVLKGSSMTVFAWIALTGVAVLLALGLSWSHLWRRLTGQVDTDDFTPG